MNLTYCQKKKLEVLHQFLKNWLADDEVRFQGVLSQSEHENKSFSSKKLWKINDMASKQAWI